jgi:hypothetical protein
VSRASVIAKASAKPAAGLVVDFRPVASLVPYARKEAT